MRIIRPSAVTIGLLAWAGTVHADEKHNLCSERPGLTTNECVIEAGHFQVETGAVDWTLERDAGSRTDTITFGDTVGRIGLGGGWEVRLGWTPFGYVRDREDRDIAHYHRVGDVTVGLKKNLVDAQKHGDVGLSFAIIPFATLPVGRQPVGSGDWSAGAQLPLGYRVDKALKFEFTPLVEAATDHDGNGRHLLYSGAFGAKFNPSDAVSLQTEIELLRDDDPDRMERGTQAIAGLSVGVQSGDKTQFDLGTNIGLNHAAPDVEVAAGFTRYF